MATKPRVTPPTAAQKAAANNLLAIAGANAKTATEEFRRQNTIYDAADAQNLVSAKNQWTQNSKKGAGERFAEQRRLQTSASSLMTAAGNALDGSQSGAISDMLRARNDLDNTAVLDTLRGNQEAVRNAYYEAVNANVNSRNEAANKTETALRGIESDTASQLNNINPLLFAKPGTGRANFGSKNFASRSKTASRKPDASPYGQGSGYILPDNPRLK